MNLLRWSRSDLLGPVCFSNETVRRGTSDVDTCLGGGDVGEIEYMGVKWRRAVLLLFVCLINGLLMGDILHILS